MPVQGTGRRRSRNSLRWAITDVRTTHPVFESVLRQAEQAPAARAHARMGPGAHSAVSVVQEGLRRLWLGGCGALLVATPISNAHLQTSSELHQNKD